MADQDTVPEAEAVEGQEVPAGKGKKKLLLIIVAVIVLIGGGIAAWLLLGSSGHAEKTAEVKAAPIYVPLDPPFVVNFESSGLVRFLQVTVQLMTEDPETAKLLKEHDPVIRNNLLMLLSGQTYETLSSKAGKEKLRQTALSEVRRVVAVEGGKGPNVKDLYFTSFVMQ